jgi:hypothetical protein
VVRKPGILLAIGTLTLVIACGGGGGGGNGGGSGSGGTSNITSVTASCSPSTLQSGQTSQCSATVTGTDGFSSTVSWSTSAGQISSSGLLTAPIVSKNKSITVKAVSTENKTKYGTASETVMPTQMASNVTPIVVDAGPALQVPGANLPFVTITICVPPGTNTCQTIDHVLVDTGSYGLRILSSVLTIPLPQEYDAGNNPLYECTVFLDGYVWGPVATADIAMAGEEAGSVPVQIMVPPATLPSVPNSCSGQSIGGNGNEGGSVDDFGANALIGLGVFQQDCGPACTNQSSSIPAVYYSCPSSGCRPTYVTLAQQVANPVAMFPVDNNGMLIQLPAVPDGGVSQVDGFLIFGIGTESNNSLGSSSVYPVPDSGNNAGSFTTIFNGTGYAGSFIDSGSNGLFFLDSRTTGIATCNSPDSSWYCPANALESLSTVNEGSGGQRGPTTHFSIENANYLFNTNNNAFSTLGGPYPGFFDWGLSFFFGRDVFIGIENMSTPVGAGPYYAYNLP